MQLQIKELARDRNRRWLEENDIVNSTNDIDDNGIPQQAQTIILSRGMSAFNMVALLGVIHVQDDDTDDTLIRVDMSFDPDIEGGVQERSRDSTEIAIRNKFKGPSNVLNLLTECILAPKANMLHTYVFYIWNIESRLSNTPTLMRQFFRDVNAASERLHAAWLLNRNRTPDIQVNTHEERINLVFMDLKDPALLIELWTNMGMLKLSCIVTFCSLEDRNLSGFKSSFPHNRWSLEDGVIVRGYAKDGFVIGHV